MPTMTKQTLNRRLNRHSMDNEIDDISANRRGEMRYSLTSSENKENFGVHFLHSPFGNNSLLALHDLSNGKSPRRAETPTSLRRRTLNSLTVTMDTGQMKQINGTKNLLNEKKVNSLTGSLEIFTDNYNAETKNHCHKCYDINKMPEESLSLSSSHMGDVTLDLVLDAIIESARKDVRAVCKRTIDKLNNDFQRPNLPENQTVITPLYVEVEDFAETSIHEMEVCTPPHLKRQRVVRRKNNKTAKKQLENNKIQLTTQISINSNNKICDITKNAKSNDNRTENFSFEEKSDKMQIERSPTPSLEEAQSIKRCLSFSSVDDDVDFSAAKRSSVASSNASSMNGEFFNFNSGRSSRSSRSSLRSDPKGSLEINTQIKDNFLNVHVIRCRDLQRPTGSTVINAYVKVAIISNKKMDKFMDNGFQRTVVHRHSSRPYFNHWFKFDLIKTLEKLNNKLNNFDNEDRLQLAVWHRDRQLK